MTVHPLRPSAGRPRRFRQAALTAARALLLLAVCAVLVIVLFGSQEALVAAHSKIRAAAPWLAALQLGAIVALWIAWPTLVERLRTRWSDEARAALLAARHRICIGLLLVELVVVFGIPFRFF